MYFCSLSDHHHKSTVHPQNRRGGRAAPTKLAVTRRYRCNQTFVGANAMMTAGTHSLKTNCAVL